MEHEDLGTLTVTQGDLDDCRISQPANVTFNNQEQRQPVELVGVDGATLVEDSDYTLTYSGDVVNAGTVTVTATGIGDYTGTKTTSYAINLAPTSTYVTLGQDGTSASATVVVVGLYAATGSVTLAVDGEPIVGAHPVDDLGNGTFGAVVLFTDVPEGKYALRATFAPESDNYVGSTGDAQGKKDLATRGIAGATSYDKIFGDAEFGLGMSAANGSATENDRWTYEVVWDAAQELGLESAVTVDDAGTVSIGHAGSSVIKVTLSDGGGVYADASAFVRVNVSKADLTVHSTAWRTSSQGLPEQIATATYGNLNGIQYRLQYTVTTEQGDEPVAWDYVAQHVTGSFAYTPVPTNAVVDTYPIPIRCVGEDVEVGGVTMHNAFGSRDYNITLDPGSLEVVSRKLAIRASDARGAYGADEPGYTWIIASEADQTACGCAGLTEWDTARTVFSTVPTVARNEAVAPGAYQDLSVGTYGDALVASAGVSTNYDVTYLPGTLEVQPADISDEKRFFARVSGTTYNASEQRQTPELFDTAFDPERQLIVSLEADSGDVVASYEGDVVNAGTVGVQLVGRGNYTGTRRVNYDIAPAPLTVVTGDDTKVYDGTPLTNASATLSGLVGDQIASIEATGTITNVGITKNTYAIDWGTATAKESNYQIGAEHLGMLAVTKRTVNMNADNKRKAYGEDNPALTFTVDGLVSGETLENLGVTPVPTTIANKTSLAGTYPIDFTDPQTSTQNYTIAYHPATLVVMRSKESIVIGAKNAGKVYDGTPLVETGFEVTGKLAEGDHVADVAMTADSSLTSVGTQPNRVESYVIRNAAGEDVTASYDDVTLQPGTLVVTRRPVTFVADSDLSRTYNGTEQSVTTWHSREGDDQGLVAGHQTNVSAEGKGIQSGAYQVSVTGAKDVSIIDGEGNDVTKNYEVTCVDGRLVIHPAELTVTTESATKPYDGKPLTAPGSITGLVEGETATLVTTGSVTDPGSVSNGYRIRWDGTARESNYTVVRENLGTLTVTAAPSNILYVCTQGDGSTWTRGSTSTITFVYKRSGADEETFSHFTGVEVDGKKLDAKAYDARSGSLVVTLKSSYLQGLSAGAHTLQPRFDDGTAQKASFTVTKKSDASTGTTGSARGTGVTSIARGQAQRAAPRLARVTCHPHGLAGSARSV